MAEANSQIGITVDKDYRVVVAINGVMTTATLSPDALRTLAGMFCFAAEQLEDAAEDAAGDVLARARGRLQ